MPSMPFQSVRRHRELFVTLICFAIFECRAAAQIPQSRALTGLPQINILVEDLDSDARACNISSDALDAAARLPLANSRIRVSSSATAYLYINVNVISLGSGLCIASITVKVQRFATEFFTLVTVWDKGQILSGRASEFGSRISRNVEDVTKMFIAAWLKENEQQ
jgi:hypothetical protein